MMEHKIKWLSLGCVLGGILFWACFNVFSIWGHSQLNVRQSLSNILGENNFKSSPFQNLQVTDPFSEMEKMNHEMDSFFNNFSQQFDAPLVASNTMSTTFQIPQVHLNETRQSYELSIPLSQPQEEKNIKIKVKPHWIDIEGQLPILSPDGKQTLGSSSFMKSFSPSQAVNPQSVQKTYKNHSLLITIMKQKPGTSSQSSQGVQPRSQKTLPSSIQQQLHNQSQSFI